MSWRISQPRTIHVGQVKQVIHHLRILKRFGFDAIHYTEIGRLFSGGG